MNSKPTICKVAEPGRRFLILRSLLAAGFAVTGIDAVAQAFPSQPVTVVVPFPAGGIADASLRLFAAKVAEGLGQQVIVENKSGAGGQIGASAVKAARPDGHTLFLANIGSHAINRSLYTKLSYDPVKDFEPVTQLLAWTHVLVVPADSKVTNVAQLAARARTGPPTSYASQGVGSGGHLLAEMFNGAAGIQAQHVPYRGTAPAMQDLIAGRIDYFFDGVGIVPFVKTGKVRALAVADSRRLPQLPDVPTMAEAGYPGVEVTAWFGLVAPAGTPRAVLARLNAEFVKAGRDPELQRQLADTGIRVVTGTPEAFATFMAAETERLGKVVRSSGARAD